MDSKSIFITGGTGKVGTQLVHHFLEKGYKVIFTSRSSEKIKLLTNNCEKFGVNNNLFSILVDLESKEGIKTIINWMQTHNYWPHTIINNARNIDYLKMDNGEVNRDDWLGELTMDVIIPYELSIALAKNKSSNLENIINISSMYGVVPANPNLYEDFQNQSPIHYGVSKAALIHLTKELSIRLAPHIRVNTVSYGGIEGRVDDSFKNRYAKLCPMGRMLDEHEVVGAADFLASKSSSGMTGQNLIVDGGWSVW